ncbi:MAG TPA: ASCH domain-containing protein [Spirochaetia bacterium]|nr:ASCH domain-containing protein [Spirochaetia bacterium]
MPALNYEERFAVPVETHKKRQTIRRERKRPIKRGDRLYHYTGQRTKDCRWLMTSVCLATSPIVIRRDQIELKPKTETIKPWRLFELDWFARRDGFDSWDEMRDFFDKEYGLPFEGVLILW